VPDLDWYINQQILPPTLRLCGVIDGTDCGRLAMIFGQDPGKYQGMEEKNEDSGEIVMQVAVPNIAPIAVTCDLGHPNIFERAEKENKNSGLCCTLPTHPNGLISTKKVHNRMMQILREAINQFYAGWVRCEEPLCPTRCKQSALERCPRKGCKKPLIPEMSAARLHTLFYHFLDILTVPTLTVLHPNDKEAIKSLRADIQGLLDQSLYQHVTFEGHDRKTEMNAACILRSL
jgi:DNA polymerase alpha subunit A